MTWRTALIALLASVAGPPVAAQPAWVVGALPPGEALHLRTGPSPEFEVIGQMRPGTGPLGHDVCVRLITDPHEAQAQALPEWCRLTRNGQPLGWAPARDLIPASDALYLVRGWRQAEDVCRIAGETALTAEFLDDSADLVACPAGHADSLAVQTMDGARVMGQVLDHILLSIPRR